VVLSTVESVEFAFLHDFAFFCEDAVFVVTTLYILFDVADERGFGGVGPMVGNHDIEEGMVVVYEDGACFALLIDAEHLDTELIGVGCCAGAGATATALAASSARRNRTVVSGATSIIG